MSNHSEDRPEGTPYPPPDGDQEAVDAWYEGLCLPYFVPPELRRLLTPLGEMYADPANLNIHGDRNLDAIEGSLRSFGFMDAIKTAPDGRAVVGNGRLTVAARLGASHAPRIEAAHLSELDALRYAISDNRTSDRSYFDEPALASVLGAWDAVDLPPGFDQADLDAMLWGDPLDGAGGGHGGGISSGTGDLPHFAGTPAQEEDGPPTVILRTLAARMPREAYPVYEEAYGRLAALLAAEGTPLHHDPEIARGQVITRLAADYLSGPDA